MSTSDIAISVRGLSKAYTIAHNQEKHVTLAETLLARLKNPLRRPKTETFWALKDIDFDIKKGDVVGIIGRNGAGKSTLLKILSRITEPTSGEIKVRGRIGSLLEVGTGFHPELTGRENIFLNGAILGMSKVDIAKQFDAIIDFAGVEQFLETPVKRYSSGMYVRLAFAVAAHLNPEILIIDEVLAVGDAAFQKKCLGKMKDVAAHGRTVLFVSHNFEAVKTLCGSGILLNCGSVMFFGDTDQAIRMAISDAVGTFRGGSFRVQDHLPTPVRPKSISIRSGVRNAMGLIDFNDPIVATLELDRPMVPNTTFAAQVLTPSGLHVFNSFYTDCRDNPTLVPLNTKRVSVVIPAKFLTAGMYELIFAYMRPNADLYWVTKESWFNVEEQNSYRSDGLTTRRTGLIAVKLPWGSS